MQSQFSEEKSQLAASNKALCLDQQIIEQQWRIDMLQSQETTNGSAPAIQSRQPSADRQAPAINIAQLPLGGLMFQISETNLINEFPSAANFLYNLQ